jgi:hypothetical protein
MTQCNPIFLQGAEIGVFGKEREYRGIEILEPTTVEGDAVQQRDDALGDGLDVVQRVRVMRHDPKRSPSAHVVANEVLFVNEHPMPDDDNAMRIGSRQLGKTRANTQISRGSSLCCAGGETGQPSDMAAGALQSADVPALAIAAQSTAQTAADAIQRIPLAPLGSTRPRRCLRQRMPTPPVGVRHPRSGSVGRPASRIVAAGADSYCAFPPRPVAISGATSGRWQPRY